MKTWCIRPRLGDSLINIDENKVHLSPRLGDSLINVDETLRVRPRVRHLITNVSITTDTLHLNIYKTEASPQKCCHITKPCCDFFGYFVICIDNTCKITVELFYRKYFKEH